MSQPIENKKPKQGENPRSTSEKKSAQCSFAELEVKDNVSDKEMQKIIGGGGRTGSSGCFR